MAIHWLTQFLKSHLINLRYQLFENTFFQGGVKIHPPSGDKGLKVLDQELIDFTFEANIAGTHAFPPETAVTNPCLLTKFITFLVFTDK